MIKRIISFCIISVFLLKMLEAQDAHFTQNNLSHQLINPAMNGLFEGQYRIGINYRDQQSQIVGLESYKTMYAHLDSKIHISKNDFVTWGIDFMRDAAGAGKLTQMQANFSLGVIKQLTNNKYGVGESYMIASFKGGMGQNSIDWSKFWFGRQFDVDNGVVNTSSPSGEGALAFNNRTLFYGDFSAGLMWYTVWSERKSLYVGLAGFHFNKPNIGFRKESNEFLYRRYTIHAGGEYDFNNTVSILPRVVFHIQGPSRMFLPGVQLRYQHGDWREVALRFGVASRVVVNYKGLSHESLMFNTTFEYRHMLFGFSYDVSSSKVFAANGGRGAFELGIQYRNPNTKYRSTISCPKF